MLSLPIRKELFWDIDLDRLDQDKNARIVIERVFNFGTLEELRAILRYYGKKEIEEKIVQAGYLDKKTLSFASAYLNIPMEKFRCYKKTQSKIKYWI